MTEESYQRLSSWNADKRKLIRRSQKFLSEQEMAQDLFDELFSYSSNTSIPIKLLERKFRRPQQSDKLEPNAPSAKLPPLAPRSSKKTH